MSYLVLARKYRPLLFSDVAAQEHVTRTLINAITAERISHAYLFTGPRGVGKTSTARILARAVNCTAGAGADPCNQCVSCREIIGGRSLDVLEIDGASNRGIDEIRDLRERVGYAPSSSRYKIYIIDEVHMLTTEAFNALLKTLEEPPSHVIFIFATTAPHKVPPTILSRCQRFDFKSVPTAAIAGQLDKVLKEEKIAMSPEVVELVARKATGAMRDALSLCDQVIAFCDGDYTVEKASQVLGVLDAELFFALSAQIAGRNTLEVVRFVDRLVDSGVDLEGFYAELARHYRNLIIFKLGAKDPSALDIPLSQAPRYAELAAAFELEDLVRSLQLILRFEEIFKFSGQQKISLELLLVRLTLLEKSVNITELISRIESGSSGPVLNPAAGAAGGGRSAAGNTAGRAGAEAFSGAGSGRESSVERGPAEPVAGSASEPAGPAVELPDNEQPLLAAGDLRPVDLVLLKQLWPQVISRIKLRKLSLFPVLSSSEPARFEDDVLTLTTKGDPYNLNRLNDSTNRQIITETIKKSFGLDSLKLEILAVESSIPVQPDRAEESRNPAAQSFEQLCRSDPLMGKIKELFDPELLA
ncbi:MAG: DNA polymerase III, subunit gamma and tau [Candidatus Glassbacteria bacterium RIFCSPLOWO2_12_FULL_58_11]|uniref:DNA polymerase III subunit gamma/tau n=1 Tax=Candidatus Glassbacteria bacterium RIFCSPLOWO2_12_FULL_58_11 TaxID=1817867 RepID=A0A1F5YRN1_9BACT|nr:MAG: DNA polymerase III, subunit gamma and tau [Candidatus Glassbacteria bacterium RIFCSPLOWO2_12_FULL_58_11]